MDSRTVAARECLETDLITECNGSFNGTRPRLCATGGPEDCWEDWKVTARESIEADLLTNCNGSFKDTRPRLCATGGPEDWWEDCNDSFKDTIPRLCATCGPEDCWDVSNAGWLLASSKQDCNLVGLFDEGQCLIKEASWHFSDFDKFDSRVHSPPTCSGAQACRTWRATEPRLLGWSLEFDSEPVEDFQFLQTEDSLRSVVPYAAASNSVSKLFYLLGPSLLPWQEDDETSAAGNEDDDAAAPSPPCHLPLVPYTGRSFSCEELFDGGMSCSVNPLGVGGCYKAADASASSGWDQDPDDLQELDNLFRRPRHRSVFELCHDLSS